SRRSQIRFYGIVRALTQDVDEFYALCDPDKDNLCLYGHSNESWEVTLPAEEVPPELPEPALGINFARDGMNRRDWLSLVAVHSDSWLLSVAFYLGARLNRNERKRLFSLINDLPTVFEVVTERKPIKDKPTVDSGSKSRGSTKVNKAMRKRRTEELKKLYPSTDVEMIKAVTFYELAVDYRDNFMVDGLLRLNQSSILGIVGKGHLKGMKCYWEDKTGVQQDSYKNLMSY
ncbi:PHD finger protein ALFIN-LIKE 2-like, partial [Trifolium pratense]